MKKMEQFDTEAEVSNYCQLFFIDVEIKVEECRGEK